MAVATSGALVAGDLLEALFVADAEAEWGAVDVEVTADEDPVYEESTGRLLLVEAGAAASGGAPRLLLQATAAAGDGGTARREGGVLLLGLGAEDRTAPPLQAVAGAAEPTLLAPDEVIVNARLAERLDLVVGDPLVVHPAVPRWREDVVGQRDPVVHAPASPRLDLTVVGVVADAGAADLHRTPNAIMRRDALQRAAGMDGRVSVTHLTAADRTPEGTAALVEALTPVARLMDLDVRAVRQQEVALAEEEGGLFRSILLVLAVVVVAAAAVATFGLLVRLGDERSRELGLLRAVGTRRRTAARLLVAESTAYGLAGAALGGVLGIPFGLAVARGLAEHLARLNLGRGREQVPLGTDVDPTTVLTAGLVIAVVAALAGRSSARHLLARQTGDLLRGTVPPPTPPAGRLPAVWWAVGWMALGAASVAGGPLTFIGVTVLLGARWASARRRSADVDRLDRRAAAAGLAWSVVGSAALGDLGAGVQAGFGVLVVAGAAAVLCATVLAAGRLRTAMTWVRACLPLGRPQAALRTAGAWAEQQRRRSTTTMATVGGVLFVVAALAVLGTAQALPVERQAGGFDVIATAVAAVDERDLRAQPGVAAVAAVPHGVLPQTAFWVDPGGGRALTVPYPVRLAGATAELARLQGFGLASGDGYATAAEALGAVALDRDKVVLDRAALPEGARVGDEVVIDQGPSPRRFRLVGVLDTFLLGTAFVHQDELATLVDFRGRTLALVRGAEGADPRQLAADLEAAAADRGLVARTAEEVRQDVVVVNRTFTDLFAVMLVLGLVVAVASIAAFLARAARERRAELAVLRALGLRRRTVVTALWAEPMLAGTLGVAIGLGVGLGLLRALFAVGFSDLAFQVDWGRLGVLTGSLLAVLALLCAVTARAATDRDVAAGLRDLG
jgi:putative ABC transport system permease protein